MAEAGHLARTWAVVSGIIALLGVVGAIIGFNAYVDHKIDVKMSDPTFIRAIASEVRPAVIFDSNGSILADLGGMQCLDSITVSFPDIEKKPGEIIVKPRVLLTFPPEIIGMGGAQVFPVAHRGSGYVWSYNVDGIYLMKENVPRPYRFRLEVIR